MSRMAFISVASKVSSQSFSLSCRRRGGRGSIRAEQALLSEIAEIFHCVRSELFARDVKVSLEGINDGFNTDSGPRFDGEPDLRADDVQAVAKALVDVEQYSPIFGIRGTNVGRNIPPRIVWCHGADPESTEMCWRSYCEQPMGYAGRKV